MAFPDHDPVWREAADFLDANVDGSREFDWIVVHKGVLREIARVLSSRASCS